MEYRISNYLVRTADFVEGIRAAVIDKDRTPKWDPDRLEAIAPGDLANCFRPTADDLVLTT
jgi:enoyl-CoA hydratase